jgi:hypothetical protein
MALTMPVAVRTEPLTRSTSLGSTLSDIRIWLDSEKIEPTDFKTIASRKGLGFEIIFKSERDAERFQQQFPSLFGIATGRA